MSFLTKFLKKTWWYVRQVSGDADYDNYLRRAARLGPRRAWPHPAAGSGASNFSPEEFYLDRLRRKYSGVSRCC